MLRIIKRQQPKFDQSKYPISLAFTVGGIDYFQFEDPANTPYKRGFNALTFYREMKMHCTLEFLERHTDAVDKILNDPRQIKIGQLAVLNAQLRERIKFIFEPDTAYKLASVVFFDKNEDPTIYDFDYCQKKIAHWKKHETAEGFFLHLKPVKDLITYLDNFEGDLNSYSRTMDKINKLHLDRLSEVLSTMKSSNENAKNSTSSAGSRRA